MEHRVRNRVMYRPTLINQEPQFRCRMYAT